MKYLLCVFLIEIIFTCNPVNGKGSSILSSFLEETIKYDLSIGIFHIGEATISYKEKISTGEKEMFAVAKSTGLVDFLYNFNFKYTSIMDRITGLPLKATQSLDDGLYESINVVQFDRKTRSDSCIIHSDSTGFHIVQKNILDILSGVYYLKNEKISSQLVIGDTISACTYFVNEVWDLKLIYQGNETIKTVNGHKSCNKFNLVPMKGHFFQKDDDVSLWFTKDIYNALIQIRLDFVVSSIKCKLRDYTNTTSNPNKIFTSM